MIHLTDTARAAEMILVVFLFLMLGFAAIGMWIEAHAVERDEDEELERPVYSNVRRLPL